MFRWDLVWQYLFSGFFLQAAWTTLWIAVVAQVGGSALGLILAMLRLSRFRLLAFPARVYIWFFRGTPLLVQLLLLWDGLPELMQNRAFLLPNYAAVLIAFSLNEGAYMAEIIRAGILSVDSGQMDAARSLGMRPLLAMRRIVLPQAARCILPPLGNEFNAMLKATSLASVITFAELTYTAQAFGAPTFSTFELLIVATCYYLFQTSCWEILQQWMERRLNRFLSEQDDQPRRVAWSKRLFGFGFPRL